MSSTGRSSERARAGRLKAWPVVLAALWMGWAGYALAWLHREARAEPVVGSEVSVAGLEAWARQVAPEPGVATVIRVQRGCHCSPLAPGWDAMVGRWARRGARSVDAPAAGRPDGLGDTELLLLAADGRLAYAGPLDAGPSCGARHPIDLLLASSQDAQDRPPLLLERTCTCE